MALGPWPTSRIASAWVKWIAGGLWSHMSAYSDRPPSISWAITAADVMSRSSGSS